MERTSELLTTQLTEIFFCGITKEEQNRAESSHNSTPINIFNREITSKDSKIDQIEPISVKYKECGEDKEFDISIPFYQEKIVIPKMKDYEKDFIFRVFSGKKITEFSCLIFAHKTKYIYYFESDDDQYNLSFYFQNYQQEQVTMTLNKRPFSFQLTKLTKALSAFNLCNVSLTFKYGINLNSLASSLTTKRLKLCYYFNNEGKILNMTAHDKGRKEEKFPVNELKNQAQTLLLNFKTALLEIKSEPDNQKIEILALLSIYNHLICDLEYFNEKITSISFSKDDFDIYSDYLIFSLTFDFKNGITYELFEKRYDTLIDLIKNIKTKSLDNLQMLCFKQSLIINKI